MVFPQAPDVDIAVFESDGGYPTYAECTGGLHAVLPIKDKIVEVVQCKGARPYTFRSDFFYKPGYAFLAETFDMHEIRHRDGDNSGY
jgi:hypothetical protein